MSEEVEIYIGQTYVKKSNTNHIATVTDISINTKSIGMSWVKLETPWTKNGYTGKTLWTLQKQYQAF